MLGYCHSADPDITADHVPGPAVSTINPATPSSPSCAAVRPLRLGRPAQTPTRSIRFEHDHYLKMWALTRTAIDADFLLLDEAQDTNPVLEQVFSAQRDHAQLVMVGDSAQAIYGWRGARDVMTGFDATHSPCRQSFRFGPALADEANRWLTSPRHPSV